MEIAPRLALWPGLCLTVTVFSRPRMPMETRSAS